MTLSKDPKALRAGVGFGRDQSIPMGAGLGIALFRVGRNSPSNAESGIAQSVIRGGGKLSFSVRELLD